jgi:hypothetical protein
VEYAKQQSVRYVPQPDQARRRHLNPRHYSRLFHQMLDAASARPTAAELRIAECLNEVRSVLASSRYRDLRALDGRVGVDDEVGLDPVDTFAVVNTPIRRNFYSNSPSLPH